MIKRPPYQKTKQHAKHFVVCVDNTGYEASLELHKIYRVIADADAAQEGDLRIVDESGEDYLFDTRRFRSIEVPKSLQRELLKKVS